MPLEFAMIAVVVVLILGFIFDRRGPMFGDGSRLLGCALWPAAIVITAAGYFVYRHMTGQ